MTTSDAATTYTWLGTGGSNDWTNTANWSPGGFPNGEGDWAILTNSLSAGEFVYLHSNIVLGGLIIGNRGSLTHNYSIQPGSGGTLTFSNGSGSAVLCEVQTRNVSDGISAPVILASDLEITNTGASGILFSSVISEMGSRKISMFGNPGSQSVFYYPNTFSGGFHLYGGTAVAGPSTSGPVGNPTSGALGSGSNGILLFGGELRAATGGATTLGNPVFFAGDMVFHSVSLEKTLTLSGPLLLSNGNRTLRVDVGSNVTDVSVTFTGNLTDNGNGYALIKTGVGNLNLAGSNSWGGGTWVRAGNLILSNKFAVGTNGLTNDSLVSISLPNNGVTTVLGFSNIVAGTGTNVILPPALDLGNHEVWLDGNYSNFSGPWWIGPGAPAGAGKVRISSMVHSNSVIHAFTNATFWAGAGNHTESLVLYGGDTGETFGQLRHDGGGNFKGPISIAGPMTGIGDGHIGASTGGGQISGTISEIGGSNWGVVYSGPGTNTWSGTNLFSGPLVLLGGRITVAAPPTPAGAGPLGSNALLVLSNTQYVHVALSTNARVMGLRGGGTTGGWLQLNGYGLILGDDGIVDPGYSGLILGTGTLSKVGSNTQYLKGTNQYSGGTHLSNGILTLQSATALGSGPVWIHPNALRLELSNGSVFTNRITVLGGGAGNQYHGLIEPASGSATLSNSIVVIQAATPNGGHFAGGLHVYSDVITSNNVQIAHRIGNVTFHGTAGFTNLKIGNDAVILGRHDALPIQGTVSIGWSSSYGSSSNSYLDLGGFDQTLSRVTNLRGLDNAAVIGNSSTTRDSTLTLTGSNLYSGTLVDGIRGGTRKLHVTIRGGDVTLSGTNTWSGVTTVDGGTLRAGLSGPSGVGGAFGSNASLVLSNSADSVLDLSGFTCEIGSLAGGGPIGGLVMLGSGTLVVGTADGDSTFDGIFTGTGGFLKTGTGVLTLGGASTLTGTVFVTNGDLVLNGSLPAGAQVLVTNRGALRGIGTAAGTVTVGMGGLLSPGPLGTNGAVFNAGTVEFQNGSRFSVDLDGSAVTHDLLSATGSITCGGNLVATNVTNSTNGSVFVILQAPVVTGTFSGILDNGFLYQKGRLFQVRYTPTNVTLRDIGDSAPPPVIEVTNPAPFAMWNGSTPITGVATNEDPTLAMPSVWGRTNGGAWVFLGATNEWTFAHGASNLGEGTNLFSFMAYLSNGLTNTIHVTNLLDRTPPTVPMLTAASNPFVDRTTVTFTSFDLWRMDRIWYTLDGSMPDPTSLSVTNGGSVGITNVGTLVAMARDMAGNWSGTNVLVLTRIPNPMGGGSISVIVPNPFRPGAGRLTVSFQRRNLERVELSVYDMAGRLVADLSPVTDSALYRADFAWDGKAVSGQPVGRGMYLLMPKLGGVLRPDLSRKLYIP